MLHDLRHRYRDPRHWSLHTKLTQSGSAILLAGGFLAVLLFEWHNARTLGALSTADKVLNSMFMSVAARSAGTAGGVKVGTVALPVLGSLVVALATVIMLRLTHLPTNEVIFEVIAAFGSAGLSTGITHALPVAGQLLLALLMFMGRVGTITLATSLVLGERRMPCRYPEEHPIVG